MGIIHAKLSATTFQLFLVIRLENIRASGDQRNDSAFICFFFIIFVKKVKPYFLPGKGSRRKYLRNRRKTHQSHMVNSNSVGKCILGFNYIINLFKCRAYPIKYEISYTFI